MTVDLPPAQNELRLLVTDLLQTFQLFEAACVQNLQDFLLGLIHHRLVKLGLPSTLCVVLFTTW